MKAKRALRFAVCAFPAAALLFGGCGPRGKAASRRAFAQEAAEWVVEEAVKILPAGARVVVWAADPPPGLRSKAPAWGEVCAAAAQAKGLDVRMELQDWPEPPLLDAARIAELDRRHAPLDAILVMSAGVALEGYAPKAASPKIIVFSSFQSDRVETGVKSGRIALGFVPGENAAGPTVRERFRILSAGGRP